MAERSEVGVQKATKVLKKVSTLTEGVRAFVAIQAVTSVFSEGGRASGR